MGSTDDYNDAKGEEKPAHPVLITRPFYLGVTEVTQGQYRAITGENPSRFRGSDDLPVEHVLWVEAVRYCNALSAKEELPPFYRLERDAVSVPDWRGPGYRLPTEAEWEYACRAGSTTRYSFGDDVARLGDFAWYFVNSGRKTHPVGQKAPNRAGLFDMHGNVCEWCWDAWGGKYYAASPLADPYGPPGTTARVIRGGCKEYGSENARSADRLWRPVSYRNSYLGFRVARSEPPADIRRTRKAGGK
jgi:formylglycine-generating enzyme required for sulfatase activity